ncbi:MAG: hypothetical protein JWL59_5096 [Chthoniobacteraceae bacterium]|nr:hypothetical protein [Chthoniobacteraceae bacterium]
MSTLSRPPFTVAAFLFLTMAAYAEGTIEFNRDIRPILSENCFQCHGPDKNKRKAKLRLDVREDALKPAESGEIAIVPKVISKSALIDRIVSTDEDEQMPPAESHKKLTGAQKEKLRLWIAEGADYQAPWAFIAPKRIPAPGIRGIGWARNQIDQFIAQELETRRLGHSPEAPKELLLRRVSFALTGLPPSISQMDRFSADTAPDAYEKEIDRLLATPQFGEHMAVYWLDAARYGDTHGLHLDNERSMWPYRDWVVRAFNENLPFDQFTLWQLAGDLIPNATRDQKIASGFNRCNVTSGEGGSINEELLFRYALDRTETAVNTWMGLTAGCAVCHDHKFDPITQKDFYSLFAFFNSAADPAMDGNEKFTPPVLKLPSPAQENQLREWTEKIAAARAGIKAELARIEYVDPAALDPIPPISQVEEIWLEDDFPADAKPASAATWATDRVQSGKRAIKQTGQGITQNYFEGAEKPFPAPSNGKIFAYVWLDPADPPKAIMLQWHGDGNWNWRANWGDKDAITFGQAGTPAKLQIGELPKPGEWVRLEVSVEDLKLKPGAKFDGLAFTQFGGTVYWDHSGAAYEVNPAADPERSQIAWEKRNEGHDPGEKVPKAIRDIFLANKERTAEHKQTLRDYFLSEVFAGNRERFNLLQTGVKKLEDEKKAFEAGIPATLVMADIEQKREAHIMLRGQYDKPGEKVEPAVPAIFGKLPVTGRATRLDLANWLIAPENPLASRVIVNRLWQQIFGNGLVRTAGDFGAQGETPSHPELLDWLAVELRESGWDIKHLIRLMLTSATFRQDSRMTPALLEADPENRFLARGPRFRLDAEELRDNALAVGGLLDLTLGGVPVRPYQPENIWEPLGFVGSNTREYKQDHGQALYRRSLYTFWKRNAPAPFLTTFDAPSRDSSCIRRERSDTPLQALLLMNDVQHFEAARALGQRMLLEGGTTANERISYGFRLATTRRPAESEQTVLKETFEKELEHFAANLPAAQQAVTFGESKPKPDLNPAELAAYTMVANVLLNMDETLTEN